MPKIKNIIIFIAVALALFLIYFFFIKSSPDQANLVSSSGAPAPNANAPKGNPAVAGDFLTLLLSVSNIKLNDSIFSEPAFNSLHDSSIILVPDDTQGRPNPFAQFGL